MAINFRLSNIPPITKATLLTTFLLSLLCAAFRYRLYVSQAATSSEAITEQHLALPFLTLIPAASYLFPWTFITASFIQQNIISVLPNPFSLLIGQLVSALAVLLYSGRYLERAWSSKEYAKFLVVCTVGPNLLAFGACVLGYYILGYPSLIFMNISGLAGLQCSYLIAFKQLVPEHTVTLFRSPIKIRVKHFPGLYLFAVAWSAPFLGTYPSSLIAHTAFLVSWVYLRFYKLNTHDSLPTTSSTPMPATVLRGDASETFSFASFFPERVQPPINAAGTAVFNTLVSIGVCQPWSQGDVELSNARAEQRDGGAAYTLGSSSRTNAPVGSARAEAERRRYQLLKRASNNRALALKALDQRLHAANINKSTTPAPAVAPMVASLNTSGGEGTTNEVQADGT